MTFITKSLDHRQKNWPTREAAEPPPNGYACPTRSPEALPKSLIPQDGAFGLPSEKQERSRSNGAARHDLPKHCRRVQPPRQSLWPTVKGAAEMTGPQHRQLSKLSRKAFTIILA